MAKQAQMEQTVNEDGSVVFAFPELGKSLTAKLEDFPQNVRDFFAIFGMRTKLRNFTALEAGEDGTPASAAEKFEELQKGYKLLTDGVLRAAREKGEGKGGGGTMELEAFVLYKRTKLAEKGAPQAEVDAVTTTTIAAELEALSEEQVKAVKATKRFERAMAEVKAQRAAAKAAKLRAKAESEDDVDVL